MERVIHRPVYDQDAQSFSILIVTEKGRQVFDQFLMATKQYNRIQDRYIAFATAGKLEEAVKLSSGEMKAAADDVESLLRTLMDLNYAKATRAGEEADAIYDQTLMLVIIFVTVSLIAALALALMYTRSLTGPIRESLEIAGRIAENNLKIGIRAQGTDEAAKMVSALAVMQVNLRNALTLIGDSST